MFVDTEEDDGNELIGVDAVWDLGKEGSGALLGSTKDECGSFRFHAGLVVNGILVMGSVEECAGDPPPKDLKLKRLEDAIDDWECDDDGSASGLVVPTGWSAKS